MSNYLIDQEDGNTVPSYIQPQENVYLGRLKQQDIPNGLIKQKHLENNAELVFVGLAANRPNGSTFTKVYFATDTKVLSIWTGTAWASTTLV